MTPGTLSHYLNVQFMHTYNSFRCPIQRFLRPLRFQRISTKKYLVSSDSRTRKNWSSGLQSRSLIRWSSCLGRKNLRSLSLGDESRGRRDAGQSARRDTSHKWVTTQKKILSSRAHQPNDKRATLKTWWSIFPYPTIRRYKIFICSNNFRCPIQIILGRGFRYSLLTKNFFLTNIWSFHQ